MRCILWKDRKKGCKGYKSFERLVTRRQVFAYCQKNMEQQHFFYGILGIFAAIFFLVFARQSKHEKRVLADSLIVAALIYVVFALWQADFNWVGIEVGGVFLYGIFYWLGRTKAFFWIGVGWLLHPFWDVVLHLWGAGAEIAPTWYAIACLTFDFVVGGYILRANKISLN